MSIWQCPVCGYEKEARCKPGKCPQCDEKRDFGKKDADVAQASSPRAKKKEAK